MKAGDALWITASMAIVAWTTGAGGETLSAVVVYGLLLSGYLKIEEAVSRRRKRKG